MIVMDAKAIGKILAHRYPILLVDCILELEANRIVGIKNVTVNEPFLTGHFPDSPVMPGVLILEAMGQVGGVLVLKSMPVHDGKLVLLASIEGANLRKAVRPGDELRIEMNLTKFKASIAKIRGTATVNGEVVADASLLCKVADQGS